MIMIITNATINDNTNKYSLILYIVDIPGIKIVYPILYYANNDTIYNIR